MPDTIDPKQRIERALSHLVEEEKLHPVTADYNDMLSDITFAVCFLGEIIQAKDPEGFANAVKCYVETVFYCGYQSGLGAAQNQPDPAIWEFDDA